MADETYRIIYEANPDKAIRGINALVAALGKGEAAIDKFNAKLRQTAAAATAADKAVRDVGKGNRSVADLTRRLKELEDELKQVTTAAQGATTASAGVGQGGPGGGGGQGGGGGGGGQGGGNRPGIGNRVFTGMAVGAGMMAGRAAFGAMAKAGEEERGFLEQSADKTAEFRESLREYAQLRHENGPNDKIVKEALDFAKEGRVLPDEIAPFLTAYEGSAATGRDKGNIGGSVERGEITKEAQEALEGRIKVVAAQFANRTGLDGKTAGDVAGVASTYAKIGSDADLAGQLGAMHYGLNEGRGEISPLARGELGQAGSEILSGRVSGLGELGAFIGVASIASKSAGSAGTTYGQVSRLLNETGDEKGEFLKEAGVADKKGNFAKLKALRDYMEKAKPDDANAFLESKGFGNATDRRSVLGMLGNVDTLERRIAAANKIAANGGDVIAANASNLGEVATVTRNAKTAEFASQVDVGRQGEKLAQGQAFARARMTERGELKATGSTVLGDLWRRISGLGLGGEEQRVNTEAIQGLIRGGEQVNVDVARQFPKLFNNTLGKVQDPKEFTADYNRASAAVEAAGGDPFGGAPKKAAKALRNAADALDQVGDRGNPGPPVPGNQGAGFNPARR